MAFSVCLHSLAKKGFCSFICIFPVYIVAMSISLFFCGGIFPQQNVSAHIVPVEIGDQSSIWFDLENENISPLVPQVHIFIFHNKTKQKQLAFDPIYMMSASGSGICYLISEFVYRLCIEELIAHTSYFHGIIPLLLTIAENLIHFDLKQFHLKVSSYWPWIFSLLSENGDPWVNSSHKHASGLSPTGSLHRLSPAW